MRTTQPPDLVIPDGMRWCPGCRAPVPVGAFGRRMHRFDGLETRCRACRKTYADARSRRLAAARIAAGPPQPIPDDATARTCSGCGRRKPASEFVTGRRRCAVCRRIALRQYWHKPEVMARRRTPEAKARRRLAYAARTPEERERVLARRAERETPRSRLLRHLRHARRQAERSPTERGRKLAQRRVEMCEAELARIEGPQ